MRTFVIVLVLSLCAASAFGYTFVLKSGKRIEGVLLFEEDTTIRIEDSTGVQMTLKKKNLDYDAMTAVNRRQETVVPPIIKEETAPRASRTRRQQSGTLSRNTETSAIQFDPEQSESENYWRKQIDSARKSLGRLKAACRNAGSSSSYGKVLRTETYWIDGKPVNVTGYWAHPANVENAKRICNEAIRTQITLEVAQQRLNELQQKNRFSTPGGSRP